MIFFDFSNLTIQTGKFKMAASHPPGVLPVFVQHRYLPSSERLYSVNELCSACEKKSGHDTILGAQKIGGLWRIYPKTNDARMKLLLSGFTLRGVTVTPCDRNPFVVMTRDGEREVKTTKVTIGNIPISFNNKDITAVIQKLGGKPRSDLFMERARDENGGLTRWITGRRFIYVEVPDKPFPDRIPIGTFTASVFHFEQKAAKKQQQQQAPCGRCLRAGHTSAQCHNDVVCLECGKPGHKRGDPTCTPLSEDEGEGATLHSTVPAAGTTQASNKSPDENDGALNHNNTTENSSDAPAAIPLTPLQHPPTGYARTSRPRTHQSTILFPRSRSMTPGKRNRVSPGMENVSAKITRLDNTVVDTAHDVTLGCDLDRDHNTDDSVWG